MNSSINNNQNNVVNNQASNIQTRNWRMYIISVLVLLTIGLLAYFFLTYGFIQITVLNSSDQNKQYSILRRGQSEPITVESDKGTIKKLVRRGEYEVITKQDTSSAFTVVSSSGLLQTTAIEQELVPEKERRFIGDNPSPCMLLPSNMLLSYSCKSSTTSLVRHVPANETTPTYSQTTNDISLGNIDGAVQVGDRTIAIVTQATNTDVVGSPFVAYEVDAKGNLSNGIGLDVLSQQNTYSYYPYLKGFVAIDTQNNSVVYFDDKDFTAQRLPITGATDSSLFVSSIISTANSVITVYNDIPPDEVSDEEGRPPSKTEVVVFQDEKNTHYYFDEGYFSGQLCGENRLCLWSDVVDVYDIQPSTPKMLFSVTNVRSVMVADQRLLVLREDGLLNLDTTAGKGFFDFKNSGYTYCGTQQKDGGIILCLINQKQRKTALYINQQREIVEPIDIYVANLLEKPEITNISIYGRYIFITPELGTKSYNPNTNQYEYNNTLMNLVREKINTAINGTGINTGNYSISIPLLDQ